jgi:hypothetical protein
MSRLLNPSVQVTLDRERYLCYGAAAFIEFRDMRGEDLLLFMRSLGEKFKVSQQEGMPLKDLRDVLWAGLVHEDAELTAKQVGNLFTIRDIPDLMPKIMEAFALALPEAKADPRKAPATPKKKTNHSIVPSTGAESTELLPSNSASA